VPDETEGRQWIVDPPPGPGEVSLYMACGDDVDLTAEQQAALSALLRTLEAGDAEVVGHSKECPRLSVCLDLQCAKMRCNPLQCSSLVRASSAGSAPASGWNLMGSFTAHID